MKYMIFVVAFLATFQASANANANICGNLSDYRVREAVFSRLPLDVALAQITKGTPFQVIIEGEADLRVSASHVSGELDSVLNALGKSSGFTYTKEKCSLTIRLIPKGRVWAARQGDDLRSTLTDWARLAGWQVVFESRSNYTIGANMAASGGIEDAVAALLEAINRDARSLHATFYYGNQVMRISTAAEGEKQ